MKRGPRWLHKFYAETNGYFWLPCPVCGRMFGGHEWSGEPHAAIPIAPNRGSGVCSMACVRTWLTTHNPYEIDPHWIRPRELEKA